MCELARNSVAQSGWENSIKEEWIGKHWHKTGVEGNDIQKTNIPDIRIKHGEEALLNELDTLRRYAPRGSADESHAAKMGVLQQDMLGAAILRSDQEWQQDVHYFENFRKTNGKRIMCKYNIAISVTTTNQCKSVNGFSTYTYINDNIRSRMFR